MKHVKSKGRMLSLALTLSMILLMCGCRTSAPPDASDPISDGMSSIGTESEDMTGNSTPSGSDSQTQNSSGTTAGTTAGTTVGTGTSATTSSTVTKTTSATSGQSTASPYDTEFLQFRNGLRNTYAKLTREKKLTVAYIGGSITAGASASSTATTSYRAKTTAWLKARFPDATITEINTGLGSAGSRLPVYTMDVQLLPHKPDLVFIETAVNDYIERKWETLADVSICYETIIRKLLTANPACDIVALYTTECTIDPKKGYFDQAATQDAVAAHYGVPSLDIGRQLRMGVGLRSVQTKDQYTSSWKKYFADEVHPNDLGHEYYTNTITAYLETALFQDAAPAGQAVKNRTLPAQKNSSLLMNARYVPASQINLAGSTHWQYTGDAYNRVEGYVYTDTSDNELVFTFTGTALYLFCSGVPSSTGINGTYQYSIDDGPFRSRTPYMAHPMPIATGLENGQHTVRFRAGGASATVPFKLTALLSH